MFVLLYRSQHEEIDLISEQEMYDTAPKAISKPVCSSDVTILLLYETLLISYVDYDMQEVTKKDEHQLMLSRLEWELEQRKRQVLSSVHEFLHTVPVCYLPPPHTRTLDMYAPP